jgi:cell division protein FtsL
MLKNKAEKDEINRKVQDMNEQIDEKEEESEELQKVYENAESN